MTHYQVLGIAVTAAPEEIAKAYRKLAVRYHPDSNSDDVNAADKFKQVALAYDILNDPQKRKQYDLSLSIFTAPQPPKPARQSNVEAKKVYPHNTVFHKNKPIPPNLRGKSNEGLGTVDLWAQQGLEEYEKPDVTHVQAYKPRKSNLIDP